MMHMGTRTSCPHMHHMMALSRASTLISGSIEQINSYVIWGKVAVILKTLGKSGATDANAKHSHYLPILSGIGRLLSENFTVPGWVWSPSYFSDDFFDGQIVDEDEDKRALELPSHAAPLNESCLWLCFSLQHLRSLGYSCISLGEIYGSEYV